MSDKKEILMELQSIRDTFTEESKKAPSDKDLESKRLLAESVLLMAPKLEPCVLMEIFNFYQVLASHNEASLRGIEKDHGSNFGQRRALSGAVLESLERNLSSHLGKNKVDPALMPWQYRK